MGLINLLIEDPITVAAEPNSADPLATLNVLVVPGWHGSGDGHWQSCWQRGFPRWARVEQKDWSQPCPAEWTGALAGAVAKQHEPVVLVAHSLGVLTVARWAQADPVGAQKVRAALLVAPPDVAVQPCCGAGLQSFAPQPGRSLPFPSLLVASDNDPYSSPGQAAEWARWWGSSYVSAGRQGHINIDSGHGPWPQGLALFARWMRNLPQ